MAAQKKSFLFSKFETGLIAEIRDVLGILKYFLQKFLDDPAKRSAVFLLTEPTVLNKIFSTEVSANTEKVGRISQKMINGAPCMLGFVAICLRDLLRKGN